MREAIHMWKLQVYRVGLDLQVVLKTTRGEATGRKSSLPHRCIGDNINMTSSLLSHLPLRRLLHHRPEGQRVQVQDERRLGRPNRTRALKGTASTEA